MGRRGRPGWNEVTQLVGILVGVNNEASISDADANRVVGLWKQLHDDHLPAAMTSSSSKAFKGRKGTNHRRQKDISGDKAGVARKSKKIHVAGSPSAQSPTLTRVMEATFTAIKLTLKAPYNAKDIVPVYARIQEICNKSRIIHDSGFILHTTNQNLIRTWLQDESRAEEVRQAMHGVTGSSASRPYIMTGNMQPIPHNDRPLRNSSLVGLTTAITQDQLQAFPVPTNMEGKIQNPERTRTRKAKSKSQSSLLPPVIPTQTETDAALLDAPLPSLPPPTPSAMENSPPSADIEGGGRKRNRNQVESSTLPITSAPVVTEKKPKEEKVQIYNGNSKTTRWRRSAKVQIAADAKNISVDMYVSTCIETVDLEAFIIDKPAFDAWYRAWKKRK